MNVKAILAAAALATASFAANAGEAFEVPANPDSRSYSAADIRVIASDNEIVFDTRYDTSAPRQADAEPARDTRDLYIA